MSKKYEKIELPVFFVQQSHLNTATKPSKKIFKDYQLLRTIQRYARRIRGKVGRGRVARVAQARRRTGASDMHAHLRAPLLACQCLGMFPATGLMHRDSDNLRFSWRSLHMAYFLATLAGQSVMTVMCLYRMLRQGFNLGNLSNIIFYGSSLVSAVLFFELARAWPAFMRRVARIESALPGLRARVGGACALCTCLVLLLATVEHILSIIFGLRVATSCGTSVPVLQAYFQIAVPWLFDFMDFSYWKGFLAELFNLQSTFMWNFNDVFIMVVSLHLTAHFQLLNKTIYTNKDKADAWWRDARARYGRLCRLVRLVDSRISGLVLVSFSCNLFFICIQLFNSLRKEYSGHFTACHTRANHGPEHSVYFTYSFTFLVLRALLVSLLAARVHSAARAPAFALYDVPSTAFSIEVQRFLDQVNFSTVALSGLQFFYVTRGMILTVFGTIVTYELVLLQFNAGSTEPSTQGTVNHSAATTAAVTL